MRLEQRVEHLELQYKSLDGTVRQILAFAKITHDMLMEHIADTAKRFERLENDVSNLKKDMVEVKKDTAGLKADMADVKFMLEQLLAR